MKIGKDEFAIYLEAVEKTKRFMYFDYGGLVFEVEHGKYKSTNIEGVYIIPKTTGGGAIFKSFERNFKRFVKKNLNGCQEELTVETAIIESPEFLNKIIERHEYVKSF